VIQRNAHHLYSFRLPLRLLISVFPVFALISIGIGVAGLFLSSSVLFLLIFISIVAILALFLLWSGVYTNPIWDKRVWSWTIEQLEQGLPLDKILGPPFQQKIPIPQIINEPIIGFRVWIARQGNLCSTTQRISWERTGVQLGSCLRTYRNHVPNEIHPLFNCTCGLHAFYNLEEALLNALWAIPSNPSRVVVGAIMAWGPTVLHRKGFRARYGKVIAVIDLSQIFEPDRFPKMNPSLFTGIKAIQRMQDEVFLDYSHRLNNVAQNYGVPILDLKSIKLFCREQGLVLPQNISHTS
jgi:hypothetical protein